MKLPVIRFPSHDLLRADVPRSEPIDEFGPVVIANFQPKYQFDQNFETAFQIYTERWDSSLEKKFLRSVRTLASTNMYARDRGSLKVICEDP
jgi:hypothetical protein